MKNKVSYAQIRPFLQKFNTGGFPHLRLGQAFVNEFKIECDHDKDQHLGQPCLFHETDSGKAIKRIWEEHTVSFGVGDVEAGCDCGSDRAEIQNLVRITDENSPPKYTKILACAECLCRTCMPPHKKTQDGCGD